MEQLGLVLHLVIRVEMWLISLEISEKVPIIFKTGFCCWFDALVNSSHNQISMVISVNCNEVASSTGEELQIIGRGPSTRLRINIDSFVLYPVSVSLLIAFEKIGAIN